MDAIFTPCAFMLTMLERLMFLALSNFRDPLRVHISRYFSAVSSERLPVPMMYLLTLTRPLILRTSPDLVRNSTVQNCPVAARDCAIFIIRPFDCLAIVPEIALCFKDYFRAIGYSMSCSIISRKTQIVPNDTKSISRKSRNLCMIKPYLIFDILSRVSDIHCPIKSTLSQSPISKASSLAASNFMRKSINFCFSDIFYPLGLSSGPIPSPWLYYAPIFRLELRLWIVLFYDTLNASRF